MLLYVHMFGVQTVGGNARIFNNKHIPIYDVKISYWNKTAFITIAQSFEFNLNSNVVFRDGDKWVLLQKLCKNCPRPEKPFSK